MWDLVNQINWTDGFFKGAFFVLLLAITFAAYHGFKFFGKRFLAIFESLTELVKKMDIRIQLLEQEQKNHRERLDRHDEHFDQVMETLLSRK